jgi:methionine-R-sulfoxide reductase
MKVKKYASRAGLIGLAAMLALAASSCLSGKPEGRAATGVGEDKDGRDLKPLAVTTSNGGTLVIKKAADPSNVCFVPSEDVRARLGDDAYAVVARGATEPPFQNAYWNNHAQGVYVDAVDGTPLFTSKEKYDSGTGWPSFWTPISQDRLELVEDRSLGMRRIEVLSKSSGAHLGHVFDDGPAPTGLRYCMNSASLRFIPREELSKEGYPELAQLFE